MITVNPNSSCREAELYYYDCADSEGLGTVPEGVNEHIRGCVRCQGQIDRLKDVLSEAGEGFESGRRSAAVVRLLKLHFAYVGERVSCAAVKPFLPSLSDPDLEIGIPTPITMHLDRCRWCSEDLERIRELKLDREQLRQLCDLFAGGGMEDNAPEAGKLQSVVDNIVKRPESEIVTIYKIDESAKAEASEADDAYAGYPIRVEEANAKGPVSVVDFGEALKRRISAVSLRPFVRVAAAAAAVILIGATLLLNTPAAKALTIDEVCNAIAKIRNVYVAKFVAGKEEPIQELWVSRTAKIYMTKAGGELVLWDIGNGERKSKAAGRDGTETTRLSDDVISDMEGKIGSSLGLVPFYDVSEVPAGAEWVRVSEGEPASVAVGTEVYDLRWTVKLSDESVVSKKWRFFVDAETNVPQKIEVYVQLPGEEGYTLETTMTVRYLSDGEMEEVVKGSSF
jgi:hypothetical protein